MTPLVTHPAAICPTSDFTVGECITRRGCPRHTDLHVGHAVDPDVQDMCADCATLAAFTSDAWWWTLDGDRFTTLICQTCANRRAADTKPRQPGLYTDIPDITYHADRASLSSSGARKLLPPSTPAEFAYERDHGRPPKKEFDHGHAAHALVLGVGAELREIPAAALASNGAVSTKAAKAFIAQARDDGAVPLKPADYQTVQAMANKIREHRLAAALLAEGQAELSGYWVDPETGLTLRFRPDWTTTINSQLWLVDYKSTTSANPAKFARSAGDFGYAQQEAWYVDGAKTLGMHDDPQFAFITQAKTPPYLVSVIRIRPSDVDWARGQNRRAIDLYAQCVETGEWPAYPDEFIWIDLPKYITYEPEENTAA